MACFLVPAAEAVATTITKKALDIKAKRQETDEIPKVEVEVEQRPVPRLAQTFAQKLRWLNIMLWGGSAVLAVEHVWHGELVPWFPFLTAVLEPGGVWAVLHEMMTAGVAMAVVVTAVWIVMVLVSNAWARYRHEAWQHKKAGILYLLCQGAVLMGLVDAVCAVI